MRCIDQFKSAAIKNPTLTDVARTAGVSYATADRVANERGNVAQKSVEKVKEAMTQLGYVRNVAAANLSTNRIYRFAFLIPGGKNAFFKRMRLHLQRVSDVMMADRVHIEVIDTDAFKSASLFEGLQQVVASNADGVAVVGLSTSNLEKPLNALRAQGVPVIGLVSDLPTHQRDAYIGINNKVAGRTAGRLIGLSHAGLPGAVALLAGSLKAQDHCDRLMGCREVLEADFPNVELLPTAFTFDDQQKVHDAAVEALASNDRITALYNVGAGNIGLLKALESTARPARFFCLVHELVSHTRTALVNKQIDVVIDQRPDVEINRAMTYLQALVDHRDIPPMQEHVPTIYVRDNVPSDIPETD